MLLLNKCKHYCLSKVFYPPSSFWRRVADCCRQRLHQLACDKSEHIYAVTSVLNCIKSIGGSERSLRLTCTCYFEEPIAKLWLPSRTTCGRCAGMASWWRWVRLFKLELTPTPRVDLWMVIWWILSPVWWWQYGKTTKRWWTCCWHSLALRWTPRTRERRQLCTTPVAVAMLSSWASCSLSLGF